MLEIRQAMAQDIATIERLYLLKIKQLQQKGLYQWDRNEITWNTLSQEYRIDEFYLVFLDAEAVGAFVVIDYDPTYWKFDKPQEALYLHKIMVLDQVEKTGISNAILSYFIQLGRDRGYSVVKLDVREHKLKLRAFYERNGFILKDIVDLNKGYLTCLYEYSLLDK